MFVQRFVAHHRFALAVAHRRQPLFLDTVADEEVTAALRTFLAQLLVETLVTHKVGVGTQFDGDVRVVVQQLDQFLQLCLAGLCQFPTPELIEDIFHLHRPAHRAEGEIDGVCLAVLQVQCVPLFLGVEVSARGGKHHILDIFLQFYLVCPVAVGIHFAVRAVAAYQTQSRFGQRVACLVIHHALDYELHLRQPEAVDLVIPFLVVAVGGEEPVLAVSGEGDTEVVACAVERCAHVIEQPYRRVFFRRVAYGFEDIQSAVTRLPVAGEIERTVLMHVRIHLVGTCVDAFAQRLCIDPFASVLFRHPYVLAALAACGVTHEIERVTAVAQCRMTHGYRTVGKQLDFLCLAPFAACSFALVYLGTQVLTVDRLGVGEIHRPPVFAETAHAHLGCPGLFAAARGVVLLLSLLGFCVVQTFR